MLLHVDSKRKLLMCSLQKNELESNEFLLQSLQSQDQMLTLKFMRLCMGMGPLYSSFSYHGALLP
jgi:hypothetical protein